MPIANSLLEKKELKKEEFKYIFDNYFDSVRNYIYYRCGDIERAADIAQETFMRVWEKQFRLEKDKISGLLYKIANGLFISSYRRDNVARNYLQTLSFQYKEQSPEQELEYEELKKKYEQALVKLPDKQRTVFLMSRMEELKYHEIAQRLGISIKAVEKRMKNALSFLNEELKR